MSKLCMLISILLMGLALCSCSSQGEANAPVNAIPSERIEQGQQVSSSENKEANNQKDQPAKKLPVKKQGEHLSMPSGFPSTIIPITKDANITSTYSDGETYSITYKTSEGFDMVKKLCKNLMKNADIIMEDNQGDKYYTINGTKDKNNIYIAVVAYAEPAASYNAMVFISTN